MQLNIYSYNATVSYLVYASRDEYEDYLRKRSHP